MVLVPADTPYTTPEVPTVATAVLLLLHDPPEVTSLSVVVIEADSVVMPVIALTDGAAFTVTVSAAMQPAPVVNVIIEVPADTPVTMPVVPTVATDVLLLLHVPPPEPTSVVVAPTHTELVPVIPGSGFTVTTAVAVHVPNE
jgi:hypothetical protein